MTEKLEKNDENIEFEYFRRKSRASIKKEDLKLKEFTLLTSKDQILKYFIQNKELIKPNKTLESLNIPIITTDVEATLEELTPTTKSSYMRFPNKKKKFDSTRNNINAKV